MNSTFTVHDVLEKDTSNQVRPPSFPQPKPNGFPEHKKRVRAPSAFKQQRLSEKSKASSSTGISKNGPTPATSRSSANSEKQSIDKENRERIAEMSPDEIAQAQKEILELDPSLVQMLLRRANLDERAPGRDPFEDRSKPEPPAQPEEPAAEAKPIDDKLPAPKKTVSFATTVEDEPAATEPSTDVQDTPEQPQLTNTTHFPSPGAVPDLDPADPDFLENLHSKYFPNLPADPARLAWMAPIPTPHSVADRESPYYPGQESIAIAQLRFDFTGRLVPPRVSRAIPTTKGLHHHGEAPEAAGYTVAELARLARSVVPSQRCIAFQTLGRILFRLGRGEWDVGEGSMGMGIFRCISEGRVLDSLREAAAVEEGRGHRGSRAYAIEALWLYEKGGWKTTFSGR